jgi:hypothetical protein
VGKGQVTVQSGIQTIDPVDQQVGLERMTPACRRDIPEGVVGFNSSEYPLCAPEEIGKVFLCERFTGVSPDRPPVLDSRTKVERRDDNLAGFREWDGIPVPGIRFFQGRSSYPVLLVRRRDVLIPGHLHEGPAGRKHSQI